MDADDDWKRLIEVRLDQINERQDTHGEDIANLKVWRGFVLGGGVVIAYVLGIASHEVSIVLHKLGV